MADDPARIDRLLAEQLQRLDAGDAVDLRSDPEAAEELRLYFEMAALVDRAAAQVVTQLNTSDATAAGPLRLKMRGYEILEEVGRGGMGIVYRAYHARTDREVALKILPPTYSADFLRLARFKKEAAAAAKINSQHVLPIFDVFDEGSVPVIVMPYVRGPSLNVILAQRGSGDTPASRHPWATVPDDQFLRFMLETADQVIEAVSAIHDAGILHRDIKPSNVLIDPAGVAWLTDFGLARVFDQHDMTKTGDVLGTPGYMSPEQAAGRTDLDERADVFSLGATLYRLLAQRLPYGIESISDCTAVAEAPSRFQPALSPNFDAVLLKTLQPDRTLRYPTVRAFEEDWRRVRCGQLPRARRVTRLHRLHHWTRVNRGITSLAGIAALMGAIALMAVATVVMPDRSGDQTVLLDTSPSGARLVFIPLDPETGEPRPGDLIHASSLSPVRQQLAPGDYLVVASLDGDSGRFHEVFRRVPSKAEMYDMPYIHRHLAWTVTADKEITWRSIDIPPADVARGMAVIPAATVSLPATISGVRLVDAEVPSFLIRPFETTVQDSRVATGGVEIWSDARLRALALENDQAIVVPYDVAVVLAEMMGMRLPTAEEYLSAATQGEVSKYPWGNTDLSETVKVFEFGPVAGVSLDRVNLDPDVWGLCSNVAEWTTTWGDVPTRAGAGSMAALTAAADDRIVCGGDLETVLGNPDISAAHRDPTRWTKVRRDTFGRGLGFRCVRSAKPRLQPEDFVRRNDDGSTPRSLPE